jgi:hypothetical protein
MTASEWQRAKHDGTGVSVLSIDPLNDDDLAVTQGAVKDAKARLRLKWCGGGKLSLVEQRLAAREIPFDAIDGWLPRSGS